MLTLILPDIPSWADEIAKPCPDMNIKVAAFTVTQKLNYTHLVVSSLQKVAYINLLYQEHRSR